MYSVARDQAARAPRGPAARDPGAAGTRPSSLGCELELRDPNRERIARRLFVCPAALAAARPARRHCLASSLPSR